MKTRAMPWLPGGTTASAAIIWPDGAISLADQAQLPPCAGAHPVVPGGGGGEESIRPGTSPEPAPAQAVLEDPSGLTDISSRVADLDWQLGRVYFMAFLNPSQGQPDPALIARLASPRNLR